MVAFGSWNVCPPVPITYQFCTDAAVKTWVVPLAVNPVKPSNKQLVDKLKLAS